MATAGANGIRIEYDCFGAADAPPVLLIAGLGVQMIGWTEPFCELLAGHGLRVIRFDNRDAGLSTHMDGAAVPDFMTVAGAVARGVAPEVPYTLDDMADDAAWLLDALGIGRAHVVGRSMGGMIAQLVASRHPGRTASLVSIMSSSGNPALPPATPEAMAMLTQRAPDPRQDEAGFLDQYVRAARVYSGGAAGFDAAAARAQGLAAVRRAYDPAGFGRQLAAVVASGDRRARLRGISARTLVIHGSDDPLVPLAAGEDTAANVPGAGLLVIPGMGHEIGAGLYTTIADAIARHAKGS